MFIEKYIHRIERIDQLIRLRATGSPEELAYRLGICKRMVYSYINEMRELGAPIEYDKYLKSYVYTREGTLIMSFKIK